ncbi:sugar MFS transporter [Brumicola blandensis]|jgi:FHS family L-fucose permease-like MFS transporter
MDTTNNTAGELGQQPSYRLPLAILTILFFMWGFITSLNDILIPHLKALFDLTYFKAMAVNSAFFGAYALVSYPAGMMVKKTGYQKGLVIGLIIASLGCVGFAMAADVHQYWVFLLALFVLASGITILQVSANPFVSHLGPEKTASSRLTLTQAFNSLGTTLAPAFGSVFILSVAVLSAEQLAALAPEQLNQYYLDQASSVKFPYYLLATVLFSLAIIFAFIKLPNLKQDEETSIADNDSVFKHRHLVLGVLAIFMYVGGEVAIGSLLVNFFKEPNIAGMTEKVGAAYVTYYWGGAMIGRFIGAYLMLKVAANKVLTFNALMVIVLIVIAIVADGKLAMWSILGVGFFNSIMFPTIFSLAIHKLGALSSRGSGFLCVAIVGGALIPPLQGIVADTIGIQLSFIVPIFCYVYIAYYGFKGYKPKES